MPYLKKQHGFSLVELSVVIVIISIILSSSLVLLGSQASNARVAATTDRLKVIQDALALYLKNNGHYPCPARRNQAWDTANFGVATDCGAAVDANVTSLASDSIRIGDVPIRDLNLPSRMIADEWNMRFSYAVTKNLAIDADTYLANSGAIRIESDAGVSLTTPANTGAYVLFSHGEDKNGGYNRQSGVGIACAAGNIDSENCLNDDNIFIDTYYRGTNSSTHFDDWILWEATTAISSNEKHFYGVSVRYNDQSGNSYATTYASTPISAPYFDTGYNGTSFINGSNQLVFPSTIQKATITVSSKILVGSGTAGAGGCQLVIGGTTIPLFSTKDKNEELFYQASVTLNVASSTVNLQCIRSTNTLLSMQAIECTSGCPYIYP